MSEEKKNLNEELEKTSEKKPAEEKKVEEKKVEAKVEAKKPLDKKTIGIIAGVAVAVVALVVILVVVLGGKGAHNHNFVDGKCECGEVDPNYVPVHTHSFVDGVCGCGETDPNYVAHQHSYIDGKCECGEVDPNYVPPVVNNEYTLGLGLVFGNITNAQTNATIATVVLDKDGKIVACKIDAIQNKYSITADGIVFTVLDTKKELGDAYGMAGKVDNNGDGIMKEWYEQAAAFEAYLVGKTVDDVKAMDTTLVNNHYISTDDVLLNAGCTIQITDFIAAVVKACEDEYAVSFTTNGDITLGLAANNADNGSTGDDFEATVKMNIDFAATVLVDGKIVAALNDAAQPEVYIEDGAVISATVGKGAEAGLQTKRELKELYGMAGKVDNNGDGIKLEWYLQSKAFSEYVVGLTPEQVANLETALVNGHYISTDDALLNAGCTIQITGIQAVVAEAAGYVAPEAEYTLGLGLVFGKVSNDQTNATIATVVLDKDGKIVACKIDAIQNKYSITADGIVFTVLDTKKELGDAYGMAGKVDNNGDGIMKEWYEQVAAFEAYVVGKTVAELEALELQEVGGHLISKDDALLTAGCTIQIRDFIDAVVKACKDEYAVSFTTNGDITLGLAANNADNGSTGDDFEATVKMNIDFAATALVDGKIVAALNDAAQPEVYVEDGAVISATVGKGAEAGLQTKRELKELYGMAGKVDNNGDGIKLEWYLQSKAFSEYVVGLTPEQVANLETALVNGHYISTDDVLLNAGCTIQITGIQAVVAEAAGYTNN